MSATRFNAPGQRGLLALLRVFRRPDVMSLPAVIHNTCAVLSAAAAPAVAVQVSLNDGAVLLGAAQPTRAAE